MSDSLKLSSALAGVDDTNGLDHLADTLAADPTQRIAAIVIFDVKEVRYLRKTEAHVPTIEVFRAEGWLLEDAPDAIRKALVARQEQRTNRTPLPFEATSIPKRGHEDDDCDHTDQVPIEDPELGLRIGLRCVRCGLIERWEAEQIEAVS